MCTAGVTGLGGDAERCGCGPDAAETFRRELGAINVDERSVGDEIGAVQVKWAMTMEKSSARVSPEDMDLTVS
jgi:hypothetical protein